MSEKNLILKETVAESQGLIAMGGGLFRCKRDKTV